MTKQLQVTMTAIMVLSTISVRAQLSTTTTTTKPNSSTTKTTVVTTDKSAKAKSSVRAGHHSRNAAPRESATQRELRELRQQMLDQQAQIDALKQASADKDARLAQANADAAAAAAASLAQQQQAQQQEQQLQTLVQQNATTVQTLSSDVSDLKVANTGLAQTLSDTKRDLNEKIDSPTTLHYKGITITPVAFFALEGVVRTRSINSDINTPFNTTPYPGANEAHTTEFNLSGRQSRLGALFSGNAGNFKLSGYVEADFLSAGTTSNENQSNSFTLRQRQIWGQAATTSGLTVTGGQMWSLVTETGHSTDPRTERLPNTIDPQYMVGFNWARQPGLRISQKFGAPGSPNGVTLAVSLEESQITNFAATNAPPNFFFGSSAQNGGLYNAFNGTPTNNVAPDVIAKLAFDTPHSHFELGGIARFDRDRYYPIISINPPTTPTGSVTYTLSNNGVNNTALAGGVLGNARISLGRYVDIAGSVMGGTGTGRYGSAQLPDVTVHPDGRLEPIRNYHGLFSLETHPARNFDVYGYAGAEYAQRTNYFNGLGQVVGYAPITLNLTGCNTETAVNSSGNTGSVTPSATCQAATKDIVEGTFGMTYRVVNSPRFGRLQYQAVYSYLTKSSWDGVITAATPTSSPIYGQRSAINNMFFVGMRYYIP